MWISSGERFKTVSDAVEALVGSDTIHLCAGTYSETATLMYGPAPETMVALIGQSRPFTVVDGQRQGRLIGAVTPGRSAISNLTLRNGRRLDDPVDCGDGEETCGEPSWGGAFYTSGAEVELSELEIVHNEADLGAAIKANYGASVTIRDSYVAGNTAALAGGGAALGNPGTVLVSENTLWENNIGGDIAFITYADDPDDVVVHAVFDTEGRTDFTCTFDTLTCE